MDQKSLVSNYSSLSRRLLAYFLDILILLIPGALANAILPYVGGVLLWFFYAPILEASSIRATLGKYLVGIQVVSVGGGQVSLSASILRNVLKIISAMLAFLPFFVALFTKKKQGVHDLLGETVVIYGRSEDSISDAWSSSIKATFSGSLKKSRLEELERLQALKEKGALTEDEYQREKEKILYSKNF